GRGVAHGSLRAGRTPALHAVYDPTPVEEDEAEAEEDEYGEHVVEHGYPAEHDCDPVDREQTSGHHGERPGAEEELRGEHGEPDEEDAEERYRDPPPPRGVGPEHRHAE